MRPKLSVLRRPARLVPVRQLAIIRELGVSEAPIYGPVPRFPVIVPPVRRLVVTSIEGPSAPAYEATVVTIMLLRLMLKLLFLIGVCSLGPLVPLNLLVSDLVNPVVVLDSSMWLRGCPGLVSDGRIADRLSLRALAKAGLVMLGLYYRFRLPVQVLISVMCLVVWLAFPRQVTAVVETGKKL